MNDSAAIPTSLDQQTRDQSPESDREDGETTSSRRRTAWAYLGRLGYAPARRLQEHLRQEVKDGRGDEHLLLLEHEPVLTLGRNAAATDLLSTPQLLNEQGFEVHETNRGGQVTYHGPGQLVGYPILDLNPDRRDVRRYVRDLGEVLIRVLHDLGISARWGEGQSFIGVWVGDEKIASLGVHLSRWVTMHGFALNISTQLQHFQHIIACGLPQVRMTSVQRLLGEAPTVEAVAHRLVPHFESIFDRQMIAAEADTLLQSLPKAASDPQPE